MDLTISPLLWAIGYLLAKHVVGDFFLQNAYQYLNKGKYGHPGGIIHAIIHAGLTAPVFFIMPAHGLKLYAAILIGEALVHYHIDWTKENIVRRYNLSADKNCYWHALGIDQFAHNLTYLVIVAALA